MSRIRVTSSLKNSSSGGNCWTSLIHNVSCRLENLSIGHIQNGLDSSAVEQSFAAQIGALFIWPQENGN